MIAWQLRLLFCASISLIANAQADAAISHVQDVGSASFASDASGDAGTFTIPVNATVQAGDIVVLEVAFAGLSKAPSLQVPVDSKGNEWFDIGRYVSGLGTTIQTFDLVGQITSTLQPGDVITIAFTPINSTGPYTAIAAAQEFSGATTLLDGPASTDGGTGSTNSFDTSKFGDLVTTNADDLIFAYVAIESDQVSGFDQTSSPAFSVASSAQGNGLTLLPLYSIESAVGSFSLAGSYTGPNAPFIVIMQALKGTVATSNADLSVGKSHIGNFRQGQKSAMYTLRVANSGNATATGAITVSDDLPAGLSFVSASGSGWSCTATGQTVTCTSTDALSVGGSSVIDLAVNVASDAPSLVVNQASVACGAPCVASGNPATDPTTITSQSSPAPVVSTPTLTVTGFLSLLALIVVVGSLVLNIRGLRR
ncbi:MAG TPA: hypothetical protein VHW73_11680 [Rudaea sp.]|jgi:uncharacterized repeat protein (TIGR01451 family)|nr:hypothetical protein [Rudaea sp.]